MKGNYLLLILLLCSQADAFSQSKSKLVVLITRANWCPTCRANDSKIKNELVPYYADSKEVIIVFNDVTNGRTKSRARPLLEAENVYDIARKEKVTGSIAIIKPSEGKIVARAYVINSIETIKNAIKEASLDK